MRIAFYCPMVDLSADTPSGDRHMAQLLKAALRYAGHDIFIAAHLRSYSKVADAARLTRLQREAQVEREAIVQRCAGTAQAPDLWFTYHPYYKAPDLIGPLTAQALAIPYVAAEASFAGKRSLGPWAAWQAAVMPALTEAARHVVFTKRDRDGLAAGGIAQRVMIDLPPFIDTAPFGALAPRIQTGGPLQLVSVAMMRGGRKLQSFYDLAAALGGLDDLDWHLTIHGDGPQRAAVMAAFAALPTERVHFAGRVAPDDLPQALAKGDLYVWPGLGEAYGLAYLEAQAAGLPVIAYDSGGVAASVSHGRTGLLVGEGDKKGFAAAIRRLSRDVNLRKSLGAGARLMVMGERSIAMAAARLDGGLSSLLSPASACGERP